MPEIISRADAKARGLKRYYTGEACAKEHIAERGTASRACMECARIKSRNATPAIRAAKRKRQGVWASTPRGRAVRTAWRIEKNKDLSYREAQKAKRRSQESTPKTREVKRNNYLVRKYGITLEERDAMLLSQNMRCACCGQGHPGNNQKWHTDHCHTTGKVRGILCHGCNTGLGQTRESVAVLKSMIAYIERHESHFMRVGKILFTEEELQKIFPYRTQRFIRELDVDRPG